MKKSGLVVGVDVPWVTSWTDEPVIGVRPCSTVQGRPALVQMQNAGYGRPQYSKNHLVRKRRSILEMLCPMCGEPTTSNDRWTQVASLAPAGLLRRAGKASGLPREIEDKRVLLDAGSIAPLHKACVDRPLKYCPHLKADPNVNVMAFARALGRATAADRGRADDRNRHDGGGWRGRSGDHLLAACRNHRADGSRLALQKDPSARTGARVWWLKWPDRASGQGRWSRTPIQPMS